MIQPLNIRTVKTAVKGATQYVQDEKIQISRRTITRFQYGDRWPEDYNSFVTSETRNNQYKDPDKFFVTMHRHPEWYARKFIFRPLYDSGKVIKEATLYANRIIQKQSQAYGVLTGFYGSSFDILVNRVKMTSLAQLDELNGDSVVTFLNTAPYASTVESNALNIARIGGVLYYAAQMVMRRYKELGVRFVFAPAQYVKGANHYYQVPTLSFGSRANVVDEISKPGKQHRRRRRVTYAARKKRLQAKAAARTAAGRRGDYG